MMHQQQQQQQQQPQQQPPNNLNQMNANYILMNNPASQLDPQLQIQQQQQQQQQMNIHHQQQQQHLIQSQRSTNAAADLHGQPAQIGLANGKQD